MDSIINEYPIDVHKREREYERKIKPNVWSAYKNSNLIEIVTNEQDNSMLK